MTAGRHPLLESSDWRRAYDRAFDLYFEVALDLAEALRHKLGTDILPDEGESVGVAGQAIMSLADATFADKVPTCERAWVARVTHNMMVKRFDAALRHVGPQVRAQRQYGRALLELGQAIAAAEAAGSPIPLEEIATRRDEIERTLQAAPRREYLGHDGISPVGGLAASDDHYARVDSAAAATDWVDRMLGHPKLGRRRRIVLLEMLAHEGGQIPGWVWSFYGWTPGNGAQAVLETKKWVRKHFPELGLDLP